MWYVRPRVEVVDLVDQNSGMLLKQKAEKVEDVLFDSRYALWGCREGRKCALPGWREPIVSWVKRFLVRVQSFFGTHPDAFTQSLLPQPFHSGHENACRI